MVERFNEPSLGALFWDGVLHFCIGALSMVACVALALYEIGRFVVRGVIKK